MTPTEALVLVGGLVLGYWVVSKLIDDLNRDKKNPLGQSPAPGSSTGATPVPWHEALKVSPDAPVEEIRRSYQMLLDGNHPDKPAIAAAYHEAMRSRGSTPL